MLAITFLYTGVVAAGYAPASEAKVVGERSGSRVGTSSFSFHEAPSPGVEMLVFFVLMAMAGVVILAFMLESGHTQFERFQVPGEAEGLRTPWERDSL